jgi:hypothetical protein
LEYFMEDRIAKTFDSLEMGIVPQLTLPRALLGRSTQPRTANLDSDVGGTKRPQKKKDEYSVQDWWKTNVGQAGAWKIPEGKTFRDFWNVSAEPGKANIARLPVVPHHVHRGTKKPLCAKYQALGSCAARCPFSHCNPARMNAMDKASTDEAFKKAYAS